MTTKCSFEFSAVPPSVNAQKSVGRVGGNWRLIKAKPYQRWIDATKLELLSQPGLGVGPFFWRSEILFPCNASSIDVDNVPKAVHDVLVQAQKVPDDRYLVDMRIRWHSGDKFVANT